jgi:putative nucleotidyltransferase with HDIG domain
MSIDRRAPSAPKKGLSPTGRVFIAAVAACGAVVVLRAALVLYYAVLPPAWLLFALLTLASASFTLKIPSINSRLAASEIFAFTSILLFGPEAGALTLALVGVLLSLQWRFDLQKTLFNFGNLGLSGWVCGLVFFGVSGSGPLYSSTGHYAQLVLPLALMTLAYYASNSGLTAVAISAESGQDPLIVWRSHFLPLAASYLVGASLALLLVVAMREVQFTAIALILPLLLISYLTFRSSFGRLEDSKNHVLQLNRLLLSTVETLATAIDAKDEVTHDHVRRVQLGALGLARELGVTDEEALKALEAAALLHDTGKIAVPEHILNKPDKLTPAEFEKMKLHAPIGAEILSSIEFPYPVVPIVRHHHENWDGTGYPDGLAGSNIPLGARILSVVDCFDALTSDRPHRRRMTDEEALRIITERRGVMYDPLVVDTFIASYQRIMPAPETAPHPVARVIGDARALDRKDRPREPVLTGPAGDVTDGLLAVTSLSRAMTGQAGVADVGALIWMIVRQVLPCQAMAIFLPDERTDRIGIRYAAGSHAHALRGITRPSGSGIAGWVGVNGRAAVNADPSLDLGLQAGELNPALRSCLAVPLMEGEALVAVLALYRDRAGAFSEDDLRLVELLAPRLASSLVEPSIIEEEAAPIPHNTAPAQVLRLVPRNATSA